MQNFTCNVFSPCSNLNDTSPTTDGRVRSQELSLLSLEPGQHTELLADRNLNIKFQNPKYHQPALFLCLDRKIVCYLKEDKNKM